ncbi:MAG: hypothetical protein ABFS32_13040 [Bacteroidota bacterium]
MKKLITAALIVLIPIIGSAQNVFLIEDMITTKDQSVNALVFNIKGEFDDAVDHYKDYMKERYEYKVDKENKTTYIIEEVDLPHISMRRGDMKTYLVYTDSMNVMGFSFLLGYDVFLSSEEQPEEMEQFKKLVVDFMDYHYNESYGKMIDDNNKALDKVKKDLTQNENKIGSLKKKVVTLAKKKDKEKDPTKKVGFDADKQLTENEIKMLEEQVTKQRKDIINMEKEIFTLKTELNKVHQEIVDL